MSDSHQEDVITDLDDRCVLDLYRMPSPFRRARVSARATLPGTLESDGRGELYLTPPESLRTGGYGCIRVSEGGGAPGVRRFLNTDVVVTGWYDLGVFRIETIEPDPAT